MAKQNNNYQDQLIEKIRENYLSIALGLLVLLVAVSIVFRANDTMLTKKSKEVAEEAQKAAQLAGREYVVKKGESVSSIARDQLGSLDQTQAIVDANKLENPERIEVGQKLILPDVENGESEIDEQVAGTNEGDLNGAGVTTTAPGGKITGDTYTVQKGDTLFNIAIRAYNNGNMMYTIMRANGLRSVNYIEAGWTLKLPR